MNTVNSCSLQHQTGKQQTRMTMTMEGKGQFSWTVEMKVWWSLFDMSYHLYHNKVENCSRMGYNLKKNSSCSQIVTLQDPQSVQSLIDCDFSKSSSV